MLGSLVLLPRFLVLRSSEEFVARARVGFEYGGSSQSGSLERAVAPGSGPESCLSWLERAFRGSSGLGFSSLDRELLGSRESFLCLVARATKASLERACFISADSSVLNITFSLSFFDQTLDPRPSLSKLIFSLRIDLPRV